MVQRFRNRHVLITGAASGIGRAAAKRIAQEEGHLALIDIDKAKLEEAAHELQQLGGRVVYKQCNVAKEEEVRATIESLGNALGGIHALSHNAGIMQCYNTHEMPLAEWEKLFTVNVTGTFLVNKHALVHLLKHPVSYIVNTSSIAADYRHPWMAAYAATKGAIKSFTRSLFIEYFLQGLRANCVLPGSIETPLAHRFEVPKGANPDLLKSLAPFGQATLVPPERVAGAIAFLASDDAFFINGTEIAVDGGRV